MQKVEVRVRPVIRHVVTRYSSFTEPDGACGGGVETLGEFDNEGYAETVREALEKRSAPREYVLVQETIGEVMAKVYYAYSEEDAKLKLAELAQAPQLESYRVYSRIREMLPSGPRDPITD